MSAIGLPQLYATLSPQKITGVTGTTLTIPGGYTAPYIIISKNGSTLLPTDYTASNGTSVTLNTAAVSTDEFGVYAFGTFNIASPQFSDAGFLLYDNADATKQLDFQLSSITSGNKRTVTVPDASGTMVVNGGSSALVSATAQASTSGTSIDFTGIPSWVRQIVVMFSGVSTNGASTWIIQIGDSGGVETTGYLGSSSLIAASVATTGFTNGFGIRCTNAADVVHGAVVLSLLDASANTWAASGVLAKSDSDQTLTTAGSKSLSATLDRVRITTSGGSDTFDAGKINIIYK